MFGNQYYQQYGQPMQYSQGYTSQNNGAMPDQLAQWRGAAQQAAQPQTTSQPITWVQGEAGAKSFIVAPGNTVMLMDSESNTFYIKTADASGIPMPLRIFDYNERTAAEAQKASQIVQPQIDLSGYITREEFDAFCARLNQPTPNQTAQKKAAKAAEVNDGE